MTRQCRLEQARSRPRSHNRRHERSQEFRSGMRILRALPRSRRCEEGPLPAAWRTRTICRRYAVGGLIPPAPVRPAEAVFAVATTNQPLPELQLFGAQEQAWRADEPTQA